LASAIHHQPLYLTPFIGRGAELDEVARLLADPARRLVTLVGPGGIGKTRLAVKVATQLLPGYGDGVWLVDLAPLCDAELVPQTAASALGVRGVVDRPVLEALVAHLETKDLLLVLDNCEHVLDACSQFASSMLATCPNLHILATSREPLHISGEVTWQVSPLSCPETDPLPALEQLLTYEAVRLFVDRAQSALPGFTLTPRNAAAIAQICCRLDGLPLAIELAAARVKMLSVAQIADRLDDRFGLLIGSDRTLPARQQTLQAALDWSYDLLSLAEQRLFGRLAVFAGGFHLDAAEAVCSGDGLTESEILDLLGQLEAKSLMIAERQAEQGRRYYLLETVRAFALDRLQASGEEGPVRDRHLAYYLAFVEQAGPLGLWGTVDTASLKRVEAEQDNWRAALQWSITAGRAEEGLRLAAALTWFWYVRGDLHEGRRWLQQTLAAAKGASPSVQAEAFERAGALAVSQGDYKQGSALLKRGLVLARKQELPSLTAWGLQELGLIALYGGDYACAERFFEDSLSLFWEARHHEGVATLLLHQGIAAYYEGRQARAAMFLDASLAMLRELGDAIAVSRALYSLSMLALHQGDLNQSRELLEEGLRIAQERGARIEIAACLEGLAGLACAEKRPERAARLFGAAEALRQATGSDLPPGIRGDRDRHVAAARAGLDEKACAAAWAAGRALSPEQAVAYALTEAAGPHVLDVEAAPTGRQLTPLQAAKRQYGGLTARERQVAALVAQGLTNAAIAAELVITVRTVEAHITHILGKLEFSSRTQIATWAVAKGLAQPPQAWQEQPRA
jgi:predicted ATPase/DNA-binding CsgD family transcriptional regulator